ncbi:MAG: ankyrin repeat domain-containing protein [Gammaproteobacteria bacterium]|nr:ankyrin repeat domain-containing protein [Gammaproteobacteria bacterium]
MHEQHLLDPSSPAKADSQNKEEANQANSAYGLINQGRDIQEYICGFLSMRETVNWGMGCTTLWQRAQPILLKKLLQLKLTSRVIDGFDYLLDVIELSPIFQHYRLNYQELATILSNAKPLIDILFKNDPNCEWKIIALCGKEYLVEELLGDTITTTVDSYGRGPLHYYTIARRIDCVKRHLARHFPPKGERYTAEEIERFDPHHKLPTLAALVGDNEALEYYRDIGYDLTKVYSHKSRVANEETLLTYAHFGGHNDTVDFLLAVGVDPAVGPHPAIMSSENGHWDLWKREDHSLPESHEELLMIAKHACKMGNYPVALELNSNHNIACEDLVESVISGGHSDIFWQFLKEDIFTLDQRFNNGETVLHLLARAGHLNLIREVLKTPEGSKLLYELDDDGRCVLHHAAIGGHYHVYDFLFKHHYLDKEVPRDAQGLTAAHWAAQSDCPWFLRRLQRDNPDLLSLRTFDNSTVLHYAAVPNNPQLLIMLTEEFKTDWLTTNDNNQALFEVLLMFANADEQQANLNYSSYLASKTITAWNTLAIMLEKYPQALDQPTSEGDSIRDILEAYRKDETFPGYLFEKVLSASQDNIVELK